jgi:hypothetical protein
MRRLVVPLVALTLLCGCDGTPSSVAASEAPSTAPARETAPLHGELLQFRRDAEARVVQIRLTARESLVVESVVVDVDGFRPPLAWQGTTTLPGGRPLDLRVTLTTPDCTAEPTDVAARVTVSGGTDPLVVPLDDGGLLRRLHESECADEALLEQVRIAVVSMTETRVPEGPALRATVRITRLSGRDAVRIAEVGGNTVYTVTPVGNLPTLAGGGSVDLVLDLFPSRCDVHALGESYRTSLIDLRVAMGNAAPRTFVFAPDDRVRRRIERFAVDTCRAES